MFELASVEEAFARSRWSWHLYCLFRCCCFAMVVCCAFIGLQSLQVSASEEDADARRVIMIGALAALFWSGAIAYMSARPAGEGCLGLHETELLAVLYFSLLAGVVVCVDTELIRDVAARGTDELPPVVNNMDAMSWRNSFLLVFILMAASILVPIGVPSFLFLSLLDVGLCVFIAVKRQHHWLDAVYPIALMILSASLALKTKYDMELADRIGYLKAFRPRARVDESIGPSVLGASESGWHSVVSDRTAASSWASGSDVQAPQAQFMSGSQSSSSSDAESWDGSFAARVRAASRDHRARARGSRASAPESRQAPMTEASRDVTMQTESMSQNSLRETGSDDSEEEGLAPSVIVTVAHDAETQTRRGPRPPPLPGVARARSGNLSRSADFQANIRRRVLASRNSGRPVEHNDECDSPRSTASFSLSDSDTGSDSSESTVVSSRAVTRPEASASSSQGSARREIVSESASTRPRGGGPSVGESRGTRSSARADRDGMAAVPQDMSQLTRSMLFRSMTAGNEGYDSEAAPQQASFEGRWVAMPVARWLEELHIYGLVCCDGSGKPCAMQIVGGTVKFEGGSLSKVGQLMVYRRPSGSTVAYSWAGETSLRRSLILNPRRDNLGFNGVWKLVEFPSWSDELSIEGDYLTDGDGSSFVLERHHQPTARVFSRGALMLVGKYMVHMGHSGDILSFVRV